jgi:hypothetical protein
MPLVFRSMLGDGDKPKVGSDDNHLGVRVKPHRRPDLPVKDNAVSPGTGGMSVNPSLDELVKRPHLVPRRLKKRFPGARAVDAMVLWRLGDGPFDSSAIADGLVLRPDKKVPCTHGVVEPAKSMLLRDYQDLLAATGDSWMCAE